MTSTMLNSSAMNKQRRWRRPLPTRMFLTTKIPKKSLKIGTDPWRSLKIPKNRDGWIDPLIAGCIHGWIDISSSWIFSFIKKSMGADESAPESIHPHSISTRFRIFFHTPSNFYQIIRTGIHPSINPLSRWIFQSFSRHFCVIFESFSRQIWRIFQ